MRYRLVQALGHVDGRDQLQVLHAWIEPENGRKKLKSAGGQPIVAHQYSNYFEVKDLVWHS